MPGGRPRAQGQPQGRAGRLPRCGASRPRRPPAAAGAPDRVCDATARIYDFEPHIDGGWYRCCGGTVRKLVDCCAHTQQADQRRRGARGLLLSRAQGLLRHVLPDQGAVLSGLELTLLAAALLAGLCGTWSPCGFSMIETIGPVGHTGGRATTLSACATFTPVPLAGGVFTFGLLSSLGALLTVAGGAAAYLVAAAIAVAAGIAELRGVRILPQLRRQLPEHWRRMMPMPVAAALYGVLLGVGFTTFVLTFGVFALAGIVFALGDPSLGVAVGIAFALGRALPIVLVAPVADRDAGIRITETMATRPGIYRGVRFGDGLALLAAAAALVGRRAGRRDAHRVAPGRRPRGRRRRSGLSATRRFGVHPPRRWRPAAPRRRSGVGRRAGGGDRRRRDPRPRRRQPRRDRAGPGARGRRDRDLRSVGRLARAPRGQRLPPRPQPRRPGPTRAPSSRSARPAAAPSSAARASTGTGSSTRAPRRTTT